MRSGLLAMVGGAVCGCAAGRIEQPEVVVSTEVGTTVHLRWKSPGATAATVSFGTDGSLADTVDARILNGADGSARAVLWGLLPSTDYAYRISTTVDGRMADTWEGTFTTGDLPQGLPVTQVDAPDPEAVPDDFIVTSAMQNNYAVVLDRQGRYRWWHADGDPGSDSIYRVRLARDGRHFLYDLVGRDRHQIVEVSLDGRVTRRLDVPHHHHDFVELPDGTLGCLTSETRRINGSNRRGTDLVEVAPDGTQNTIWSAWDSLDYDPLVVDQTGAWTHGNALDYDPEAEVYRLSLRNLSTIYTISRTGEVLGAFGNTDSDYTWAEGAEPIEYEHQFEFLGDHVLVFDNGDASRLYSRAVEFALDDTTGTATQVWEYRPDPDLFEVALGDVDRLSNGDTLVTFSLFGQIVEVTPDARVIWQLNTSLGGHIGYVQILDDLQGHH